MRTEAQPKGGRVVAPLYNEGWPVYNTNHSYGDLKCPKLDKNTFNFPPKYIGRFYRQNTFADFPPKSILEYP